MKNFQQVLSLDDDPRFGSIIILCDPDNPRNRVMKKTEIFKSIDDINYYKMLADKKMQLLEPRLQVLKHYDIDQNNLSIDFYYEYLDEFLSLKELDHDQIINLFQHICEAIIQNKQISQNHGDIRPELISFNSQKQYYLLQRKNQQKNISDVQKKNIKNFKPIYLSPELFERLMRHQKLDDIDIYKNDLFSLGFMCLEAFEEHDFLQEFYNFSQGIFEFDSMQDKLDLILKRNLPNKIQEFINFLKHYILVSQEKRSSPEEAHEFILDIKDGKKLFESTNQIDIPQNENVQYYNPFDFVSTNDIIPRTVSIDNRQQGNHSPQNKMDIRHRDESLIDISQNAKVHRSMGQNNILVVTQSQENQTLNQNDSSDIKDIIENLKYFKLKLQEPAPKQPNQINFKGLFYPIAKSKQNQKISPQKQQNNDQNAEDMYDYLQQIGIKEDNQQGNPTSDLDKKLRETAKFDDIKDIQQFDNKLKNNKLNNATNLRGFLKNSSFKKNKKQEQKIKSAKKIDKSYTIVKQFKKQENKNLREKSARRLMMNNYNILDKKSENNINLKLNNQSYDIGSFNQNSKNSILSQESQNNKNRKDNYYKQNTFDSIEKINKKKIQNSAHNNIQTPKRNYQPSSLQNLNQKRTTKSHKQESNKLNNIQQINPISQQINNINLINQKFVKKNSGPSKIVSIKNITVNGKQDIQNMKSSNFLNCYNDQYIKQYSQSNIQSIKNQQQLQQIYNVDNLKERESWQNYNTQQNKKQDSNLHLYQKFQHSPNKFQSYSSKNINNYKQKTLSNTNIITPQRQTQVEERQSTQWVNSYIPSQKETQYNSNKQSHNFQKKYYSYRNNQF